MSSRLESELRRLTSGPLANEKPLGVGMVRFVARCPLGSTEVLEKVKDLITTVDKKALSGWPSQEWWSTQLPPWFVSRCAPQSTKEESDQWLARWRSLPREEQKRLDDELGWTLENWLYWMKSENRQWFWWDAKAIVEIDHVIVAVEVDSWPFPWGSLRWLFKAAGAADLEPEE